MEALEMKNGEYLHDHKIFLDVAKTAPGALKPNYSLAEKLCYEDYRRRVIHLIKKDKTGLNQTPVFLEAVAVTEKTLCVTNLSPETKISHIMDFFKDVVHVRLVVKINGEHAGYGYVEFASPNKAKEAMRKNGEYLQNGEIALEFVKMDSPKYCIDHNVWYEDYLREESLLIEEDEAVEGLDETCDFVEEVAETKRTLFVANPPCRIGVLYLIQTRIKDINRFFCDEEVVRVRLSVDSRGKHTGSVFVEFASADSALKTLERKGKWNKTFYLDVVKTAPYPLRPKYNLAEKLWYEDYRGQFGQDYFERLANMKKRPGFKMDKVCNKKITFPDNDW